MFQTIIMEFFENVYMIIFILNLFLASVIIFLERKNVGETWAWLMVLFFLPVVGFILYVLFGQNLSRRKLYRLKSNEEQVLQRTLEQQRIQFETRLFPRLPSFVQAYRDMIMMNMVSANSVYTQDNDVRVFTEGRSKFNALLHEIEQAREHIHLLYFIIKDDRIGRRVRNALIRKAREGVDVRLLYDHIGCYQLGRSYLHALQEAGVKTATFFPSKIPYLNIRVNYRNHRKIAVIDGKVGFLGGLNIGDEYLGRDQRRGFWRDTHLWIRGSAVAQLQAQFLLDWNVASSDRLEINESIFPMLEDHSHLEKGRAGVQIVSSGPDDPLEHIKNAYIKMILKAQRYVWIQTPYFIPDQSFLDALRMAAFSGVDVRMMIPRVPDHKMVYWTTYSYLGDLLPLGVRCFLYEKGFLHAKTILVDGFAASIGTANFDMRSFKLNFETNAFIYDDQIGQQLQSVYEEDLTYCTELLLSDYEQRPRLHKVRESITRLLSPIM